MPQPATVDLQPGDAGLLKIRLAGDWILAGPLPPLQDVLDRVRSESPSGVAFETDDLGDWDTALLTTLLAIHRAAEGKGIAVSDEQLPDGARRLLRLAATVKEPEGVRRHAVHRGFVEQVGQAVLGIRAALLDVLRFIGVCVQSLVRLVRGRATYQGSDFLVAIQEAGVESLPIVSLVSFLIGMIFAFVGVRQLQQFGAGIYVANLVAVAMVREMAPIMTAIIMAGRTGAAYAAALGAMKVNEEIDALASLGVNPIDFLVLPRLVALVVMMPLLALYGSLVGILGGAVVSLVMLDVSLVQYAAQTAESLGISSLLGGLFKALVYGSLVAVAGCEQGMACGRSAMAVGQATTRAVVMGIVLVICSAALLTVIYITLDI